ncbi:MAG: TatD family nuclease-associated radical SAM protein [Candidatus Gastranaerophilales bacterium]|nr:TatD family nuclease-associated radical SAM protein [Candidatus Gastranaerophilales bacterium]
MNDNDTIVYELYGKTYINLTNSCTNECEFCIRDIKDNVVGNNMWLEHDNIIGDDVIEALVANKDNLKDEIVYCGYGEPTLRLSALIKSAKYIKENFKNKKIRLNTNGHGNLVYKADIVPQLAQYIDSVSISLNAQDEKTYNQISKPKIKNAYQGMLDFVKKCKENGIDTTVTVVTHFKDYEIDVEKCRQIAQVLGVKFREREYLNNGY